MAWEEVEPVAADKYWNPEKIGDNIEGNVFEIVKDQWNNDRIVLDLGDDAEGNLITTTLPAHAQLRSFIPKLKIGEYINVEFVDQIPPTEKQLEAQPDRSPTNIYAVKKDPARATSYE
ncbi:hypothetical protein [Methanobrevibacter sp.]|uniref:hypothetical protein n=1 Tax=Methanobrevibacter sp. TaxID=66852 RepID=UPI0025E09792|nr:hypothetical protein [Methanobrevibacter sp.]MBQ2832412.1 hypothetical protein [Methanobrevibacter sp.]